MSRLLILDNCADLLSALEIFFERKEYKVKILSTAFDLISEMKSFNPDVLMLDVVLNGMMEEK